MSRTGLVFVGMALLIVANAARVNAQSGDESAERMAVDRFASVLEKNPRRGTAFDKVYAYHVERGTLNELVQKYQTQAKDRTGADAAACSIILGLIESHRGNDSEAIAAYIQAEKLDSKNAMAPYYLGRTLAAIEQISAAAEAFERAIERQTSQADLLETFQALGRLYQRAHQRDKALVVWTRLERQFPNDARVQEQIATTLLEENDLPAALSRYEALAKSSRDKSRQLSFEVEAADIKSQLGQSTDAILDFERILKQLNPDHWQFRDVRRRIEAVFQKSNNQAGLIDYYEKWLQQNPSDLEVITRLARQLIAVNRGAEAQEWLKKGLKLAPSNKDLRLALINQLQLQTKYADAIAQYAELDHFDPNNPDTLKAWGRTLLKETSRDPEQRQQAATNVWRRMLAVRPNDAQTTAQVADLLRQAGIVDEALSLYRLAIEQAPESAQYREYLGDYLQSEKRTPEAIAAWREIATGKRKTAPNLARLAEILARVGELPEAIEANATACQMDPKDFALQLKQADLLSRANRHREALEQLRIVQKMAATDDEQEAVWNREFTTRRELKQLAERIDELRKELAATASREPNDVAARWHWLARAYESESQAPAALTAIRRANELDPKSIRILATSARLHEGQQSLSIAVEQYRRLAEIDRRFRSEYLQKIALLEEKLGHTKQALQAGRDLLAAVPGNPEISGFFAELCFRNQQDEEGLQTLRKAARANPADLAIRMRLASALMERKQIAEAIDLLWQAFERSQSIDDRLQIVQKLTEAHVATRELNRLYIRLERERRDAERHRELTFCLAKAYEVAGQHRTAQIKLETLLTEGTRDTQLLTQLRFLSEHQQNFTGAANYQRRIWEISATKEDRSLLLRLLLRAGKTDDAVALLVEQSGSQELSPDLLALIDGLLASGKASEALVRIRALCTQFPNNWELHYREAAMLTRSNQEKSTERFEELLRLNVRDDEPSLAGPPTRLNFATLSLPAVDRLADIPLIQQSIMVAIGSGNNRVPITMVRPTIRVPGQIQTGQPQIQHMWQPRDFGQARMAALCWLVQNNAVTAVENKVYCKSYPGLETPTQRQHYIDRLAIFATLNRLPDQVNAARELAKAYPDDIEAKVLYLLAINNRAEKEVVPQVSNGRNSSALSDADLDDMLSMYREIAKRSDLNPYHVSLLAGVQHELHLANRIEVLKELGTNAINKATTETEVAYLLIQQLKETPSIPMPVLLDRLIAIRSSAPAASPKPARHAWVTMVLNRDQLSEILSNSMQQLDSADEMLSIWTRYAQIQGQSGLPAAPSQQPTGTPAWRTTRTYGFGGQATVRMIGIPTVLTPFDGSILDFNEFEMLRQLRTEFSGDHRTDSLMKSLRAEADSPDQSATGRLFARTAVAAVQSLEGQQAEAVETLWAIAQDYPQRQDLRVGIARQFAALNQPKKALEILDGTDPNACPETVRRLLVLRLANATNDLVRAKVEATWLASKTLSLPDLGELVNHLVTHKMYDIAEEALARHAMLHTSFHLQRQLLDVRLKQDKLDSAADIAVMLLTRLDQPLGRLADEKVDVVAVRRECYETLQKSGQLAKMIESNEKLFATSPRSEMLIDRLLSYYEVTDNRSRINELQFKKLELQADKPENRFAIGLRLMEAGKLDKSFEQLQLLIERDPHHLAIASRDALFRYDKRKELTTFAATLVQLDWGAQERQLIELPSVVHQLCQRPATEAIGQELFQKTWNAHPERRGLLLAHFKADKWWDREEVRNQFASAIIPQSSITSATEEWNIFGLALGNDDPQGELSTVLNRILTVTVSHQRLDQLATEIEQAIQQQPTWESGPVILALIDLSRERVEAGRDRLDLALPKVQPILVKRPTVAWEIAQELARHPQSLDVAAKYFDIAIRHSERVEWMTGASPGRALIDAFVKHGRQADARKLLIRNLPDGARVDAKLDTRPQPADIAQILSICHRLSDLDYPMDTIAICDRTLERLEKLQVGGYDPRVELQQHLVIAFTGLKPEWLPRYVAESQDSRPLSMLLFVRGQDRDSGFLKCRWDPLLAEVAKSADLTNQTQSALDRLSQADSNSLSPLIMSTRLAFSIGDNDRVASNVSKLVERLKATASRLESATSEELAKPIDYGDQIALWLVARRCLLEPKLRHDGITLGQRALEAARWGNQLAMRQAIRTEWLRIAQDLDDKAMIERVESDVD